jgi:uncharacterized protein YcgI (DUF1989 family)
MRLEVMLTGAQHAVLTPGLRAGGIEALARTSIAADRDRAADPAWAMPRARHAGPAPAPAGERLLSAALPAASAVALALRAGQRLWLEQLDDGQGVDVRVFDGEGRSFSAAQTRAAHGTAPSAGARLLTTSGRPLLTIAADSAPGHDLLYPPCCEAAYLDYTGLPGHRGCAELAVAALAGLPGHGPAAATAATMGDDVLNLWLPTAVDRTGWMRWWPAWARRGDVVGLAAQQDVTLAVSTCPDDMFGTSQYEPKPVRLTVFGEHGDPPVDTSPWPAHGPAAALADRRVPIEVDGEDLAHLDAVAAAGWLGDDRATVLRALLLRHHQAMSEQD